MTEAFGDYTPFKGLQPREIAAWANRKGFKLLLASTNFLFTPNATAQTHLLKKEGPMRTLIGIRLRERLLPSIFLFIVTLDMRALSGSAGAEGHRRCDSLLALQG